MFHIFHSPSLSSQSKTSEYDTLLAEFPTITKLHASPQPVWHSVTHHIHTIGTPVHAWTRQIPFRFARQEFELMTEQEIIQPSDSQWSSPFHMAPKKALGYWWPFSSYFLLNCVTIPDHYPIPHIQDLLATLHGSTIFSKWDLIRAYHQIPLEIPV